MLKFNKKRFALSFFILSLFSSLAHAQVNFLTPSPLQASMGPANVSWSFEEPEDISDVQLIADRCRHSPSIVSPVLEPNNVGVYQHPVNVGSLPSWYYLLYKRGGIRYRSESQYINPQESNISSPTPPVIWYFRFDHDPASLEKVLQTGKITHVLIGAGQRDVIPYNHPNIVQAIDLAHDYNVKIIWSRHLYNRWGDKIITVRNLRKWRTYTDAIEQVKREAALVGAQLTALDTEIYGPTKMKQFYAKDVSPINLPRFRRAIILGKKRAGKVDFIYPAGSHMRPLRLSEYTKELGRHRIGESTYYDLPEKNCSVSYKYKIFGAFLNSSTENGANPTKPLFLPNILERTYLWQERYGAPRGVNGLFIYTSSPAQASAAAQAFVDYYQ